MGLKLTAAMLNEMCQKGMTVEEMANNLTNLAGAKVSVGYVRKACKHYSISLRAKPRKGIFELDAVDTANTVENTVTENTNVEEVVNTLEESVVGQIEMV